MTTLTLVTILTCVVKHIEFSSKVIFECSFTMDLNLFMYMDAFVMGNKSDYNQMTN